MSENKKWNTSGLARTRRKAVVERLTAQLASGVKTQKKSTDKTTPLEDADKKRITKEVDILKGRV
jgi:hypothetical protein